MTVPSVVDAAIGTPKDDDDQGEENPGTEQLGDAGKPALDRMKDQLKTERTKRRDAEAKLALTPPPPVVDVLDPQQMQRDAEKTANEKAAVRILNSEIKAAAAGKLADPADAHKFLDLASFDVDDEGNVDETEIVEAIDDLIKRKPYLAAQSGKQTHGSNDGGVRKGTKPDLDAQILAASKAGNHALAIQLKRQKAYQIPE